MIIELDIAHAPDRALGEIKEGMQTLESETGRILIRALGMELWARGTQQGFQVKLAVFSADIPLDDGAIEWELFAMWIGADVEKARAEQDPERERVCGISCFAATRSSDVLVCPAC
ncbi:MAG: hypothetical protein JW990_09180 [Thermoleophilia bacterium]|nr:hypothetical protein [Thermoleophilia bacterium]